MHGQLRNELGENQLYTDDCNDDLEIDDIDISKVSRIACFSHLAFSYPFTPQPLSSTDSVLS